MYSYSTAYYILLQMSNMINQIYGMLTKQSINVIPNSNRHTKNRNQSRLIPVSIAFSKDTNTSDRMKPPLLSQTEVGLKQTESSLNQASTGSEKISVEFAQEPVSVEPPTYQTPNIKEGITPMHRKRKHTPTGSKTSITSIPKKKKASRAGKHRDIFS